MNKQIPIVVGVVLNQFGQILIGKRNEPTLPKAHGKWELLGGKIDFTETPEQALAREIEEESGLKVFVKRLLPKIFVNYWQKGDENHQIFLLAYECTVLGGELHTENFDHRISALQFVDPKTISSYDMLPFDSDIIKLLES